MSSFAGDGAGVATGVAEQTFQKMSRNIGTFWHLLLVFLPQYSILKHLPNVETRFYCPQTFLSLDFQCRDDVSELK